MGRRIDVLDRLEARTRLELSESRTVAAGSAGTFADFIRTVSPTFGFYRHVDVLVDHLQAVADGRIRRLMIFLPPRHTKSLLASRLFPAYFLRRHPDQWVGLASYGAELAEGFSREARAYFQAHGGTLDPASRATNRWNTTAGGGMWAVGVGGSATGRGYSLGIVDDPVKDAREADSPTYRQRARDWWDSVFSTRAEPDAAQVVIQCMTGDTPVAMADGTWKPLSTITPGDRVKAWKSGRMVDRTVLNHVSQGDDAVFEIRTGNHTVRANARHPFLVALPDGSTEWRRTTDLRKGDRLVCSGRQDFAEPARITGEEAWLLGYFYGDGWVTVRDATQRKPNGTLSPRRGFVTCIATPKPAEMCEKVLRHFHSVFGIIPKLTRFGYWRTDIARIGRRLQDLGFKGNAKTKRVPDWMFSQPIEIRRAFLLGYLDADGHVLTGGKSAGRWSFGCNNHGLLQDIRHLARACGFMPTNVSTYRAQIKAPNSPEPIDSITYGCRLNPWSETAEPFREATIRSVEPAGQVEVFDMQIEDAECFLADGLVSHNTRWHLDDLSGFLLETESTTERPEAWHVVDLPAIAGEQPLALPASCTVEPDWRQPGEPLCPERFPLDRLETIRASTASRWWQALYQQRPTLAGGAIFVREWLRYYDPAQLPQTGWSRLLASIDCTFKEAASSDFVALTIWGQRAEGLLLLDVIHRRMGFTGTVTAIGGAWERWRFSELLVEDAANGPAVIDTLKRTAAGYSIRAVRPLGGKAARANAAAPQFEQGRIWLPQQAPWLQAYVDQLLAFPSAAHDDLVDSTTQAINHVAGTGPMRVSTVHYGRGSDAPPPADPFADADMPKRRRLTGVPGFR